MKIKDVFCQWVYFFSFIFDFNNKKQSKYVYCGMVKSKGTQVH